VPDGAAWRDRATARRQWLVRGINVLMATTALVWTVSAFPNISDPAAAKVAGGIARGESYDPEMLRQIVASELPSAERLCNWKSLRNLLILQFGAANDSVHGVDLDQADFDVSAVNTISRALLGCAPEESIGWLGVYWSGIRQEGFGPRAAAYLAQSYRTAPHEAWIQLIRAPLALRSYDALSPELKQSAVTDFQDVFRADLFPSAVLLLKAATTARTALLDSTCDFPEHERLVFQHYVDEAGLTIRHRCFPADDRPAYMRD
jgi:hypothetical protein